jgi:hypothetical protein
MSHNIVDKEKTMLAICLGVGVIVLAVLCFGGYTLIASFGPAKSGV